MKKSSVTFSQLRRMLLDLQFADVGTDAYRRFEHAPSGAVFLFRPYSANEYLTMQDLVSTRNHLEWRGLLSADVFDDTLTKARA